MIESDRVHLSNSKRKFNEYLPLKTDLASTRILTHHQAPPCASHIFQAPLQQLPMPINIHSAVSRGLRRDGHTDSYTLIVQLRKFVLIHLTVDKDYVYRRLRYWWARCVNSTWLPFWSTQSRLFAIILIWLLPPKIPPNISLIPKRLGRDYCLQIPIPAIRFQKYHHPAVWRSKKYWTYRDWFRVLIIICHDTFWRQ